MIYLPGFGVIFSTSSFSSNTHYRETSTSIEVTRTIFRVFQSTNDCVSVQLSIQMASLFFDSL